MDLLLILVAGMVLTFVWRVHDLFVPLRPFRLLFVTAALTGAVWLLQRDPRRSVQHLKSPTSLWLGALVATMVLSVPTSVFQGASLEFVLNTFSKTLFFAVIVASTIRSVRDVERLSLVFVIGALLYASQSLKRALTGFTGRLGGTVTYDPNDLAALLVVTIPLAVYFLVKGRNVLIRSVGLSGLLVCGTVLAFTVSRGGFLGFVAVMAYILLRFNVIPARKRAIAAGVVVTALLVVAGGAYWDQISTILEPSQDYNVKNAASGRLGIWRRGIGYMAERPFFGVGVGQFSTAEGRLSEVAQARAAAGVGFKWSASHNSFVQVGAELGIPGLVVFVGMLLSASKALKAMRERPRADPNVAALSHALTAAVLGYCVSGFFLSHAYYAYLYFLVAVVIGLAKLQPPPKPGLRLRDLDRGPEKQRLIPGPSPRP